MEITLPWRINQRIFSITWIKMGMDTYQRLSCGTLYSMHSVSKNNLNKMKIIVINISTISNLFKLFWQRIYFYFEYSESTETEKSSTGHLQVLLAKIYSHGNFSSIFEQLDLNKNGKIDPREIDETLEDQNKPRKINGNFNFGKVIMNRSVPNI